MELEHLADRKLPASKQQFRDTEESLLYVLDEKGHSVHLTDQGVEYMSPSDKDAFVLPDNVAGYEFVLELIRIFQSASGCRFSLLQAAAPPDPTKTSVVYTPVGGAQQVIRHVNGDGECAVHAVRAAVGADDVAVGAIAGGRDDGSALGRAGGGPLDRKRRQPAAV